MSTPTGIYTPEEADFLRTLRIGRLATISPSGFPHVVPLQYVFNAEDGTIDLGGKHMGKSKKYRDAGRNGKIAFVVDDAGTPGIPRGIEIRGTAEVHSAGGQDLRPGWDPEFIRLHPAYIASWGISSDPMHPLSRPVL